MVSGTANLNVIDIVDVPVSLTIVDEIITSPLDVVLEMNVGEATADTQSLNLFQCGSEIDPQVLVYYRMITGCRPAFLSLFVMASGDGSKIFLPSHDISSIEKAAASYDASSEQLTIFSTLTSSLTDMSVDGRGSRVILSDYRNDQAYVYDENYNQLGILPPLNGLDLISSRVSHALSPDGSRAYLYISSSGKLHVLDLTTSDGADGFAEIGSGTVISDAPTDWTKMTISPDGGSLFISSNSQLIVFPVP